MSYTATQLSTRVLQTLNVLAAGEAASAEDATLLSPIITNCHAELRRLSLAPFALTAIPEWAFEGMVDYVASNASPCFGRPKDMALMEQSKNRLRQQVLDRDPGEPVPARYF